jgi:hypothetical protein
LESGKPMGFYRFFLWQKAQKYHYIKMKLFKEIIKFLPVALIPKEKE